MVVKVELNSFEHLRRWKLRVCETGDENAAAVKTADSL